jgi:hypothetical protein
MSTRPAAYLAYVASRRGMFFFGKAYFVGLCQVDAWSHIGLEATFRAMSLVNVADEKCKARVRARATCTFTELVLRLHTNFLFRLTRF